MFCALATCSCIWAYFSSSSASFCSFLFLIRRGRPVEAHFLNEKISIALNMLSFVYISVWVRACVSVYLGRLVMFKSLKFHHPNGISFLRAHKLEIFWLVVPKFGVYHCTCILNRFISRNTHTHTYRQKMSEREKKQQSAVHFTWKRRIIHTCYISARSCMYIYYLYCVLCGVCGRW